MINIITSFYTCNLPHHAKKERDDELKQSLKYNLESNYIKKIHLYIDDQDAYQYVKKLNNSKINIISINHKPTYSDLFKYCFENLQNEICMITNSDIYLYDCDNDVLNKLHEYKTVFSLTRYEYNLSKPLIDSYGGSHDCFIFKAPLQNILLDNINHYQNHWNSEGVVLFELNKIECKLFNPCHQIKIVHLHKSNIREHGRITYSPERRFLLPPCIL